MSSRAASCAVAAIILAKIFSVAPTSILAAENSACDALAAAPTDPARVGPGVAYDRLDPRPAISACEVAVAQSPSTDRFKFQLARALSKTKRIQEAAALYRELAEKNYAPAAYNLSLLLMDGNGIDRNTSESIELLTKAAKQGYALAQYQLGILVANGRHVPQDPVAGRAWYEKAAQQGHASAENELGWMLKNGFGGDRDMPRAIELFKSSAAKGNHLAEFNLGKAFQDGLGVGKDPVRAAEWLGRSAQAAYEPALYDLAVMYQHGNGVAKDERKAAELFLKSAERGNTNAETNLAFMYANGQGVERNYKEAQRWYTAAAKKNNGFALASLGWLNHTISDLPRDDIKAYIWYQLAIQAGYTNSFLSLGELLADSLQSPALGRFNNMEAAARQFVYANSRKLLLKFLSQPDLELRHRLVESRRAYAKARKDGDDTLSTISRIAKNYALTATLKSDLVYAEHPNLATRALQLTKATAFADASQALQKAIDLDSTPAMLLLANLNLREDRTADTEYYYRSLYREEDTKSNPRGSAKKAAELYEMAAKRGSFAARVNLAALYELGHGVRQNKERARTLYQQALQWSYNGPAKLGLLRLSLDDLWSVDAASSVSEFLSADKARAGKNDIFIKPLRDYANFTITDQFGRRMFSGSLQPGQSYRVPRMRNDLIFWPQYDAKDFVIQTSTKTIKLNDENLAGVRLDRERLAKQRDFFILNRGKTRHSEHLPDETLAKSRIKIVATTDSSVFVHDNGNLFGIENSSLRKDEEIRLPNLALTLVVRPYERYQKEPTASNVSIIVDKRMSLTVTAPPGCWITVRLDLEMLRLLGPTQTTRVDCGAVTEGSSVAYIVDTQNRPIAYASKPPDEQVQGVIAGFIRIARGAARFNLLLGGRADELYRADKIFLAQDLRQHGPNSFDTVQSELYLAESEIGLGYTASARTRLDGVLVRLSELGEVPADLEASALETLGSVLLNSGRYREAEQVLIRSLTVRRKSNAAKKIAPEFAVWGIFEKLSLVAERLGEPERALMYGMRSYLLDQADNPQRGEGFNAEVGPVVLVRTIELLRRLDRHAEAQDLLTFAHQQAKRDIVRDVPEPLKFPLDLSTYERSWGPVDRSELIAKTLGYLGQVYSWMDRHQEALPLFEQLQKTSNNLFGDGHPKTAMARAKVAEEYRATGKEGLALSTAKTGFNELTNFIALRSSSRQSSRAGADALRPAAFTLLDILYPAAIQSSDEAFQIVQRLRSSSAAAALQALAFRLGEQRPEDRDTIRRIQDAGDELVRLDSQLMASLASTSSASTDRVRERISRTEATLRTLQGRRSNKNDLAMREGNVSYDQLKELLELNEALVLIEPGVEATYVFVATRLEGLKWFKAEISLEKLTRNVTRLRCGLDGQQWRGESRERCRATLGILPIGNTLPFDLAAAHEIYSLLIKPAEDILAGKNLIFCLSGPLTSLPPQVLVTRKPAIELATTTSHFKGVDWLTLHHAVSVVPSVASFAVMRTDVGPRTPTVANTKRKDFIGLGNPALSGNRECKRAVIPRDCSQIQEAARRTQLAAREGVEMTRSYFRGNGADVDAVRKICPLPETEVELRCVAKSIGGQEKLVVGNELTETQVKQLPLDTFRVVHFATHGLLADEARSFGSAIAEPALVLTPPGEPSAKDDGLLTASEISHLKLNADWVILSACNTAAAGSFDTDPLSGLARAFFYAGAKTLLVSHWAVDSAATVVFISRAFDIMKQQRDVEPAEALRQSMLDMIRDPALTHPAKWAPFVLIGDSKRIARP